MEGPKKRSLWYISQPAPGPNIRQFTIMEEQNNWPLYFLFIFPIKLVSIKSLYLKRKLILDFLVDWLNWKIVPKLMHLMPCTDCTQTMYVWSFLLFWISFLLNFLTSEESTFGLLFDFVLVFPWWAIIHIWSLFFRFWLDYFIYESIFTTQ